MDIVTSSSSLPIIDIGPLRKQPSLLDPQDLEVEKVIKQLDLACKEMGFFYVFFKEFELQDPAALLAKPLMAPNQWPAHPKGFQPLFEQYIVEMTDLARSIMQGIALALGGPCDAFEGKRAGNPFWILRVIGYPPKIDLPGSDKDQEPEAGCAAHTDYGLLTLVNQDADVTALQVKNRDGEWLWVEPVAGAFVVNIGDMLKIWSNGIYPSTLHRVMNQSKYRVSVPFFYEPNFNAYVEPLEFCIPGAGDNSTCVPVIYGKHVVTKVLTNFG
ncbi:hypothetical protein O6H91_12G017000 [Diphasiastrum complanatum]|uniref:Uncharacterized protein n=1 Tax=Diphasiastrum complanatum TaxID=34168 RepID=A0ACC2BZ57_DIPCM|nr:hypothetical protein O6H91_12G017000 [Diphasiastrum complanatum]